MKAILLKELKSIFSSSVGAFFALAYLLITGLVLWVFSGRYNFIDNGYADMSLFFWFSSILFMVLIPALTMRLFAEERRSKTYDVLMSRPISLINIYIGKFVATYIFVATVLLATLVYVYSLYLLAYPEGNLDLKSILASYISLLLLIAAFISIGMFGSSITRNQVVAFIISLFLSTFVFYGFDLLAVLGVSGKAQETLSSLGLAYHYQLMQRGVIQLDNIVAVVNYLILFVSASLLFLRFKREVLLVSFSLIVVLNVLFACCPDMRFDFTNDKRYTLSNYTSDLLKSTDENDRITINIFLGGELNSSFQRLLNAVDNLLKDYGKLSSGHISFSNNNPYLSAEGLDVSTRMANLGMQGVALNETDREGRVSRKTIYPYAQIIKGADTLTVSLLKNVAGYTGEENLNASVEELEYTFANAIRLLLRKEEKAVAFIEGHDELPRESLYDAEELLSRYYSVNRGQIGQQIDVLDNFDAIIIAGPLKEYSELEKYIVDQYIMSGGKVLWLIDGTFYSYQDLVQKGQSPTMKNELNLDDMLFSYGVRINADLIQDKQSASVLLVDGDNTQSSTIQPNYYLPLLMPSLEHPVTNLIRNVKAGFASSIDVTGNSPDVEKRILLTTSENTHLVKVPDVIDFDVDRIQDKEGYFDEQFVPVAISLEGSFNSTFANRPIPDSVVLGGHKTIKNSSKTKMIVVSSSDLITNEILGQDANIPFLPMGYDRVGQTQYGNREFILNALNWLTGDEELMSLRTKKQQMYMLNRHKAYEERNKYSVLNVALPPLLMLLIMGIFYLYRKRYYGR